MARLTMLRTMLAANSLEETAAFYETLGFRRDGTFGDPPVWCQVERDGVRLMFTWDEPHVHEDDDEPHSHAPEMSGTIYINSDDVDGLHASFVEAGVASLLSAPESMAHGMREFAVRDPNGYVLIFGQPV